MSNLDFDHQSSVIKTPAKLIFWFRPPSRTVTVPLEEGKALADLLKSAATLKGQLLARAFVDEESQNAYMVTVRSIRGLDRPWYESRLPPREAIEITWQQGKWIKSVSLHGDEIDKAISYLRAA